MPKYRVTSPDGKTYEITAPDGATQEEVLAYAQSHYSKQSESNPVSSFLSGTGSSVLNMGASAADLFGKGETLHQWAKEGEQNAQGTAGNIGKAFGGAAPYFALPGSLVTQSIGTGVMDALTSSGDIPDRIKQGLISAGSNALLGKTLQEAGAFVSDKLLASKEAARIANMQNLHDQSILAKGRAAGFTVPPAQVNPTWLNNTLQSISGKFATKQAVQKMNSEPATKLARETIGARPGEILVNRFDDKGRVIGGAFHDAIQRNMEPYETIRNMGDMPLPGSGMNGLNNLYTAKEDLQKLQDTWTKIRRINKSQESFYSSENARKLDEAYKLKDEIEQRFMQRSMDIGDPELMTRLNEAKVNIAKINTVEDAVNKVTGKVDAREFGKLIDKQRPITGPMRIAGEFEQAFPQTIRAPESVPEEGVNQLMRFAMPTLYGIGGATVGSQVGADPLSGGILGGAIASMAPGAARKVILSPLYQRLAANVPQAKPSNILSILDKLVNNELSRRSMPYISKESGDWATRYFSEKFSNDRP